MANRRPSLWLKKWMVMRLGAISRCSSEPSLLREQSKTGGGTSGPTQSCSWDGIEKDRLTKAWEPCCCWTPPLRKLSKGSKKIFKVFCFERVLRWSRREIGRWTARSNCDVRRGAVVAIADRRWNRRTLRVLFLSFSAHHACSF